MTPIESLRTVLAAHPDLLPEGFYADDLAAEHRERRLEHGRSEFYQPTNVLQFVQALQWLRLQRPVPVNYAATAADLAYAVGVQPGILITAALAMGVEVQRNGTLVFLGLARVRRTIMRAA